MNALSYEIVLDYGTYNNNLWYVHVTQSLINVFALHFTSHALIIVQLPCLYFLSPHSRSFHTPFAHSFLSFKFPYLSLHSPYQTYEIPSAYLVQFNFCHSPWVFSYPFRFVIVVLNLQACETFSGVPLKTFIILNQSDHPYLLLRWYPVKSSHVYMTSTASDLPSSSGVCDVKVSVRYSFGMYLYLFCMFMNMSTYVFASSWFSLFIFFIICVLRVHITITSPNFYGNTNDSVMRYYFGFIEIFYVIYKLNF